MLQVRSSLRLLIDQEQHKQCKADAQLHFNINSASCGPLEKSIAQPSPNRSHQMTASQGVLSAYCCQVLLIGDCLIVGIFSLMFWGLINSLTGLNCEPLLLYPFSYFTSKVSIYMQCVRRLLCK